MEEGSTEEGGRQEMDEEQRERDEFQVSVIWVCEKREWTMARLF